MARTRILRVLVALYVVSVLSPLLTTSFGHSCALGRFMIDDGSGLAVGPIELRDGILFLAAGCNPAAMTVVDEGREGTRVRTAWASRWPSPQVGMRRAWKRWAPARAATTATRSTATAAPRTASW